MSQNPTNQCTVITDLTNCTTKESPETIGVQDRVGDETKVFRSKRVRGKGGGTGGLSKGTKG